MFETYYGEGIINKLYDELAERKVLFVTQENLYEKYKDLIPEEYSFRFVDNVEEEYLEQLHRDSPGFQAIVGFGGGMSIDAAKYLAWRGNTHCYLVPTAISVDACYSYPIALRKENVVFYKGEVIAKGIYVDYNIIRSAPRELNLSGVGDVLSCYTALFDWSLMSNAGKGVPVEASLYRTATEILEKLFESAKELAKVSNDGIRLVMDAYRWVGMKGYENKYCHFEEGSEHFLAYTIESICGKHLLHGQLVCLCAYIMSKLQREGRQNRVKTFTDEIGLSIKPEDVGLSYREIESALRQVNRFAVEHNLSYSVLNEIPVTEEFISETIRELKSF